MQILRLGFTETTLLFYYWLEMNHPSAIKMVDVNRGDMINWLYSTSGFYDKQVEGTYFNFNANRCLSSTLYHQYMSAMFDRMIHSDLILCFHDIPDSYMDYKKKFITYLQSIIKSYSENDIVPISTIYQNIQNKKVLIINPTASLMKQQYDSERLRNIYPDFPTLENIIYIENPYTFFNKGPDENILETADKISKEIETKEFDIAIVSCGAYSSILAHYISKIMRKDVITMGGDLLTLFGIKTRRDKRSAFNEYWISVPEHLKPNDYMKIENGCYW